MPDLAEPLSYRASPADAERVSLVHASDDGPGIRRRRSGAGFSYAHDDDGLVGDKETLARIRALAIPPAWTDVWISDSADTHLQATGRDVKGRKQYRYHERWSACRDEVKYSSLPAFARTLPLLRARIDKDLRRRDLCFERVVASVVWLLDNTMIRIGNAAYARDNKSFGLTTLRDRHVDVEGAKLRFDFRGKSGKQWQLKLVDRRIARTVKQAQDLPGQRLFQYIGEDGKRHGIASNDINDYIKDVTGTEFSAKHFRTWGGTVRATSLFAELPPPESQRQAARAINAVIDQVAGQLGNTRSVCRKCYVHPKVIESWENAALEDELARARRGLRVRDGLDRDEEIVLRWLSATTS